MKLVFASIALGACTRKPPERVKIFVHDANRGVPGFEISVAGKLLGVTSGEGNVEFRPGELGQTHFQVLARPLDNNSPYASAFQVVDLPLAFFPKSFAVNIPLRKLAYGVDGGGVVKPFEPALVNSDAQFLGGGGTAELQTATNLQSGAEALSSGVKPAEADLPVEVSSAPVAIPTMKPIVQIASTPAPILNAVLKDPSEEDVQKIEVAVTEAGKPLAGAQVFSSRAATRSLVLLGTSGIDGVVGATLPKFLRMEQVLVRHECCKPVLRPVTGAGKFSVDLEKGRGLEVVLQHDSYGISRAIPNAEVFVGSSRIDVAGNIGLVALPFEQIRGSEITLVSKDAVPERITARLPDSTKAPVKPVFRISGLRKAALPILGILEAADIVGDGNGDLEVWRRFRREFHARFLQSQAFRPMIFSDVQKLASSAKLAPGDFLERGWEFSIANPEMDLLVELRFEKNPKRYYVRLVNRSGVTLYRDEADFKASVAPEKMGAIAFENLLRVMPFEGTVTEGGAESFFVNLGSEGGRGLERNQFVEVYGWAGGDFSKPRNELVAIGKISSLEASRMQVHVTHKMKTAFAGVVAGMRAVRVQSSGRNQKTGEPAP